MPDWFGAWGLVVGLAMGAAGAGEERPFTAFSAGGADVIVGRPGEDYLRFGVGAWGPKWAWTGLDGKVRSDRGAAVATIAAKMRGTDVPFRIGFRAECPDPKRLALSYELLAENDTALTLVMVEFAPGKAFEGRDVMVESGGKQTPVRCPFERRGLGSAVEAIRLTDDKGLTTVVKLDPPCEVGSDGPARIVLAKERLAGGEARRLKLAVELPAAANWFPSVAEVPDEPGIEAWYPWQAKADPGGGAIGMQDWLDAPAGKHGRIVRQGEELLYNGKPLKLWGLNLCYSACAPEKELADRRTAFYRKYGINAVRLHKYADGPGWGGIQAKESFVQFDPDALDRMDYQIAKLKEAGIYVKLSAHFGSQKLGPADKRYVPFLEELGPFRSNRVETPHSAVHYSRELQDVQILHTTNLLKHKNPYTGLTYAEEPAIAFIEIINEQSILFYTTMAPLKASATIRRQTGERFCEWLRKKYGSQEKLEAAWGKAAFNSFANEGFAGGEQLDKGSILPIGNPWFWDPDQLAGSQAFRRRRLLDSLQFLYELQCDFYLRYLKAVRDAGYQGEIVSTNWQAGRAFSHFANLHSDSLVGTIDRHNYFGGRANASMLSRAGSGLLSTGMQQVAGLPFMFSEWIHVFPNEWGVEGPAIIGAYGMGLQGWDVSYMFQNRDNAEFSEFVGRQPWDVMAPQVLGVFPAVARHIHRGDVKESEATALLNVHPPSLFEGKLGFGDKVVQGYDDKELDNDKVSARALAVARCAVAFTDDYKETPPFDLAGQIKDGQLVSTTGQLRWKEGARNPDGFFTMDTAGTKAVVGFAQGQRCELGGVTIEPQCRFAAVYVVTREKDATIDSARELLIVAIARARNAGMKFSPSGDRMLAKGNPPIVMEPVKARIALARKGTPKVIALDHDGKPTDRTLPVEGGAFTIDGAKDRTPYYLVHYEGGQ
ncbi:MAG: hypothetical protein FJ291_03810 [Planctomycetes bacterium]|nr:hypothetical protein [Planctomycetota bacterium]